MNCCILLFILLTELSHKPYVPVMAWLLVQPLHRKFLPNHVNSYLVIFSHPYSSQMQNLSQIIIIMQNINLLYFQLFLNLRGVQWPCSQCTQLRSEFSRCEPWLGTLCCVHEQDTLRSYCLSPLRCINVYWLQASILCRGEQSYSWLLHASETRDMHQPGGPLGLYPNFTLTSNFKHQTLSLMYQTDYSFRSGL